MAGVMEGATRGGRMNRRSAPRLTMTARGAVKAASDTPTSRSQARAPERAFATYAGEGRARCRLAVY